MMDQCELSILMPAYLEEENLRILLPRLRSCLMQIGMSHEILVIDTQSPLDATEQVCEQLGARHIRRKGGDTFGDAVRTGIASSTGRYVLCMDADGSHPPEFVEKMWAVRSSADVVIASRYVKGGVTENSLALVLMSRLLNVTYRIVLGLPCRDVSNSLKLYRGDAIRALRLTCDHFDIVEEILFRLFREGRASTIREIPFTFKRRLFGDTKRNLALFVLSYAFTILKLRFVTLRRRAAA